MRTTTPFLLSLTLPLLFAGCSGGESSAQENPPKPPVVVSLAQVTRGTGDSSLRFVGRMRAASSADLYTRAEGQITAVYAGAGDPVKKGQVLARIDSAEAEQELRQARASLQMAEATLQQRLSDREVATANARRTRALSEQKLVSQSDLDVANARSITADSQVELARAAIEQAHADVSAATLEVEKSKIVAPFSGYIGTRHLDLGAYATPNRPIFSIVDLAIIRMTVSLPASAASQVTPGSAALVTADALPGQSFNGRVRRISSVFDPQTDTVEAEVEIANSGGILKPGMYGSVAIQTAGLENSLLVPSSAVVRTEEEQWIFVAEPGPDRTMSARRVPVRAAETSGSADARVAINPLGTSIEPGTNVIVLGQNGLEDGDPVVTSSPTRESAP